MAATASDAGVGRTTRASFDPRWSPVGALAADRYRERRRAHPRARARDRGAYTKLAAAHRQDRQPARRLARARPRDRVGRADDEGRRLRRPHRDGDGPALGARPSRRRAHHAGRAPAHGARPRRHGRDAAGGLTANGRRRAQLGRARGQGARTSRARSCCSTSRCRRGPRRRARGYGDVVAVPQRAGRRAPRKLGAVAVLVRSVTAHSLRTPHTGALALRRRAAEDPGRRRSPSRMPQLIARLAAQGPVPIQLRLESQKLPDARVRERDRRAARPRAARRDRRDRRAPRLVGRRAGRARRRRRLRDDDAGARHAEGARAHAAPHDPRRAVHQRGERRRAAARRTPRITPPSCRSTCSRSRPTAAASRRAASGSTETPRRRTRVAAPRRHRVAAAPLGCDASASRAWRRCRHLADDGGRRARARPRRRRPHATSTSTTPRPTRSTRSSPSRSPTWSRRWPCSRTSSRTCPGAR